jgi:putative nucleotidyltransferase with HDIG domain
MSETVLFVDDELSVLKAVRRVFDESPWNILSVVSGEAALNVVREQEVAVVVSDFRMPAMSGVELLRQVRDLSPDTVKIMMTAHGDFQTALAAINSGEVFRFIVKPWDEQLLLSAVQEGVGRHQLLLAMRRQDEDVFRSLAQTIELKDPYTRGHCDRVAYYALLIAQGLNVAPEQLREIRFGSWLHDCGKIGVPEGILNSGAPLAETERETVNRHPEWGADVARQARLSQTVINIILHHHEKYDGSGYPSRLTGTAIPLEARIVGIADVYDALHTDRPYRKALDQVEASRIMREMKGSFLDPELTELFFNQLAKEGDHV